MFQKSMNRLEETKMNKKIYLQRRNQVRLTKVFKMKNLKAQQKIQK